MLLRPSRHWISLSGARIRSRASLPLICDRESRPMHDTQPPITSSEEYDGYRAALEAMNTACIDREQRLFDARGDPAQLEKARAALLHIYRRRQGIIDAIADYERKNGLRSA
jgi:hypothetical protein